MIAYIWVVWSEKNLLELVPLFFLGSTLIFIGYDLIYEWIFLVRHKLIWREYMVLLFTFVAIHIVGMDFGIILGVIVAVIDYVMTTAQACSIIRINKRSKAVWKPDDWKLLQTYGYGEFPKIITIEVRGSVFFGTSMQLLSYISEEIGLDGSDDDLMDTSLISPHVGSHLLRQKIGTPISTPKMRKMRRESKRPVGQPLTRHRPDFLVLDLSQITNLDATAARGCFLQLAKMCSKRGIIVCASGLHPASDWMLRSHDVAHSQHEEDIIIESIHTHAKSGNIHKVENLDKLLLFITVYDGLEFCENIWIERFKARSSSPMLSLGQKKKSFVRLHELGDTDDISVNTKQSLSHVFSFILGLDKNDKTYLDNLEKCNGKSYHEEISYKEGDVIFKKGSAPDGFFVILCGSVTLTDQRNSKQAPSSQKVISGAGYVRTKEENLAGDFMASKKNVGQGLNSNVRVGGIFSFVDFTLERPRIFGAIAAQEETVVAKFSRTRFESIKSDSPEFYRIIQSVLLQASVMDLANCTCSF